MRGSELAAGWDLASAENTSVPARGKAIVKTNLAIAIPTDCYARIAPRSGLAAKKSIDVGAGVVDADYRGEVGVILFNHGDSDFEIKQGDRIAQMILEKCHLDVELKETTEDLPETARGSGGFGSTGIEQQREQPNKKPRPVSPSSLSPDAIATQLASLETKYADLLAKYELLASKI